MTEQEYTDARDLTFVRAAYDNIKETDIPERGELLRTLHIIRERLFEAIHLHRERD